MITVYCERFPPNGKHVRNQPLFQQLNLRMDRLVNLETPLSSRETNLASFRPRTWRTRRTTRPSGWCCAGWAPTSCSAFSPPESGGADEDARPAEEPAHPAACRPVHGRDTGAAGHAGERRARRALERGKMGTGRWVMSVERHGTWTASRV